MSRAAARLARVGLVATLAAAVALVPQPARADTVKYVTFDIRSAGSIYDFDANAPIALPLHVPGGVLGSTAHVQQGPKAYGSAGVLPIPTLTSLGIIIPRKTPIIEVPIPQAVQDGLSKIDYTKLPNFCQAEFPPAGTITPQARCGGPSQSDSGLGLPLSGLAGEVQTTANPDVEDSAQAVATSSGVSGGVTAALFAVKNFEASAAAGLNKDGVPEASATATVQELSLLGGAVKLDGLHSESRLVFDGTEHGLASDSSFRIEKATVLGIPITLGPDGFAVAGKSVAGQTVATLTSTLNRLLHISGLEIRLFPPTTVTRTGSQAVASSGGLEINYTVLKPVEVHYSSRFGLTQANITAVQDTGPEAGGSDPGDGAPTDAGGSSGETPASGDLTGTGSSVGESPVVSGGAGDLLPVTPAGSVDAGVPSTVSLPAPAGTSGGFVQRTGDQSLLRGLPVAMTLHSGRLKSTYLLFMLLLMMASASITMRRLPLVSMLSGWAPLQGLPLVARRGR